MIGTNLYSFFYLHILKITEYTLCIKTNTVTGVILYLSYGGTDEDKSKIQFKISK